DLESVNGTYVDGLRVFEHVLQDESVIEAGETEITFFEGKPVLDRPADPVEALLLSSIDEESAVADAVLLGDRVVLTAPVPDSQAQLMAPKALPQPRTPLPFTRPRPYPRPVALHGSSVDSTPHSGNAANQLIRTNLH